jgi:hypothetical protein
MDNPLARTVARFCFYLVALVLLVWTASLTYSFVANALPNLPWYVPLLALIVFDAGMIAWLVVFLHYAEGSGQRAVAIGLTLIDLIGVGLMVIAEILLGGQTWAVAPERLGEAAIWGIGGWTVVNVAGVITFHLLSPAARVSMALQGERDAVFDAALSQLRQKRQAHGTALADQLSDEMLQGLVDGLRVDRNRDGVPDVYQRDVQPSLPGRRAVVVSPNSDAARQNTRSNNEGGENRPY